MISLILTGPLILAVCYIVYLRKVNSRQKELLKTTRKEKEKLKFKLEEANNRNERYKDFLGREGYEEDAY